MAPIGAPVPAEATGTSGRSRERFGVLGVWIDAVDQRRAQEAIESWIADRQRRYVCVSNVHSVMEARRDESLRAVFNAAGLAVPDGMPLVWVGRLRGRREVRRVYGPDLTLQLCERAARRGDTCFFYGGRAGAPPRVAAGGGA